MAKYLFRLYISNKPQGGPAGNNKSRSVLFEDEQNTGDCRLTGRFADVLKPPCIAVNNHQEDKQCVKMTT